MNTTMEEGRGEESKRRKVLLKLPKNDDDDGALKAHGVFRTHWQLALTTGNCWH
jgi:hypothetical protein